MTEGILVEWTIEEGDSVEQGDVIAVVETEKVSNDVEAREDGVVRRLLAEETDVMEPGAPMGILAAPDEDIQPYLDEAAEGPDTEAATVTEESTGESQSSGGTVTQSVESEPVTQESVTSVDPKSTTDADVKATPGARQLAAETNIDLQTVDGTGPGGAIVEEDVERAIETAAAESTSRSKPVTESADVQASPGARKLAQERGVDISTVDGTGPEGTIIEADIERTLEAKGSGQSETQMTVTERKPLSSIQQRIGDRLQSSFQEAPHVTLHRTYRTDVLNDALDAADWFGVEVSMNDILLKSVAEALSEYPEMNAHFEDGEHVLVAEQNVAFAVDTDDGLLTPVVSSVSERSIQSVSEARRELTERALDGQLTVDDLQGGTFTVSNLGMFGVDQFTPIINPPQIAILGVGREREDGTMTLSLSFDHRVVNGADAAKFLSTLTDIMTTPAKLAAFFEVARS